jgi:uncharacterized membrane protein HdeD (DUF308 family)
MITTITRNSIIRSVLAIVAGLLMILWPYRMGEYMVMAIGALFIFAGIYTLVLYVRSNNTRKTVHIVSAVASLLLGVWLILVPDFFIKILMYVWGILLVLAGIQQIVALVAARRYMSVPVGYYILPSLIIAAGIVITAHPGLIISYTFIILGTLSLLYGLNELIGWYKFRPQQTAALLPDEVKDVNIVE